MSTSGNLDVVIKNLMQTGLVEKTIDEKDRRGRIVRLTEAGEAKVVRMEPPITGFMTSHILEVFPI